MVKRSPGQKPLDPVNVEEVEIESVTESSHSRVQSENQAELASNRFSVSYHLQDLMYQLA